MLHWTLRTLRRCREMRDLAAHALSAFEQQNEGSVAIIKDQMKHAVAALQRDLPEDFPACRIGDLGRHIAYSMVNDYQDILKLDLPDIEEKIEAFATRGVAAHRPTGFDELLHPLVRAAAIRHYEARDFRNAVLDAITAVFDKIRERTGIDQDGERLINQAMSLQTPILVLSEIETESGRNDQSGFMDIFKGFYRGVRNPKAHSLVHDLDAHKAGQHLVLASILMRRVVEAKLIKPANAPANATRRKKDPSANHV
jgi:uncharacterized protein (TIGR02391 family)